MRGDQAIEGAFEDDPAAPSAALLSLRRVVKTYPAGDDSIRVLDGVDFQLNRGEFVAIKGPSGAGKSTLLHIAAGLDFATSGEVVFDGVELAELPAKAMTELRRRRFGFVFQFFNLLPGLSVRDNVALPLLLARSPKAAAAKRAGELIDTIGLADRASHLVGELSGGEMQRVAVARAIAPQPDLIFADEPTGNLDSRNGEIVMNLLTRMCAEHGTAVLLVTHDETAAGHAHRIVEMSDGTVTGGRGGDAAMVGGGAQAESR